VKRRVPSRKFLIARGHDGGAVLGEFGNALGIERKELLNREGVSKVEGFLGAADDIFQAAEEQDFHANGLRDRRHKRIVAREGEPREGVRKDFLLSTEKNVLKGSMA